MGVRVSGVRCQAARRLTLAAILLVSLARAAVADFSVYFDVQPRAVRVGEPATMSLTVHGLANPPGPQFSSSADYQITMAGTERSMSFGTGGSDSSVTFRYQLLPLKAGRLQVGPFDYVADNRSVTLPAIELQVVAQDAPPSASGQPQQASDILFAVLQAPQTNLYNQQFFDIYLSIFSRGLNIGSDIGLANMPASGLSLQPFQELQSGREVVDNQLFDVRRFRCKAQALTAGTFKLEPTLRIPVQVPRERRRRPDTHGFPAFDDSFFEDFFGRTQVQRVDVNPKPVDLAVQPLPVTDQPTNYSGAVGRFHFTAQAKPTDLSAGDPITLTVQITGEGNLENLSAPQILAGDDFKVYEPKVITSEFDGNAAAGRKVFEQVLIPRSERAKELPPLTFSFFDPATAQYRSITQGPFPLTVHPSSNAAAKILQAAQEQPEARTLLLGADIVYLKPAPARWVHRDERPWYGSPGFWGLQLLPPLVLGALLFAVRRREELEKDVAKARRQQAPRSARVALKKAEAAAGKADRKAFFEAVWEALASYFGNRLNLPPGAVTRDTVTLALTQGGLDPSDVEQIRSLFERCEQERFGMGSGAEVHEAQFHGMLQELSPLLRKCERVKL